MARSSRSKSITDNKDATDLFFHGFSLYELFGFQSVVCKRNIIRQDPRLMKYPHVNPINPCSKKNSVVKRTRIYRIDTDTSLVGSYCLPDSSHYMSWKSRDFVPGYSRFARYWLPAKSYWLSLNKTSMFNIVVLLRNKISI